MGDLISPGVQVKEKDLTTTVRSEPTSVGCIGIIAQKGPVKKVTPQVPDQFLGLVVRGHLREP